MENKNILLVGVGGQGTILASKLLTLGLMENGYDVKMSEIHGMSQRGGSVSSQIRFGSEVQSPVIENGTADMIVAFEKMEAVRWLGALKPGGKIVVNDQQINPIPVTMGKVKYPDKILEYLKETADVTVIEALEEAKKMGNMKVMNIILLGTVIKYMDLGHIDWDKIIKDNVKPNFVEINQQALRVGQGLV